MLNIHEPIIYYIYIIIKAHFHYIYILYNEKRKTITYMIAHAIVAMVDCFIYERDAYMV